MTFSSEQQVSMTSFPAILIIILGALCCLHPVEPRMEVKFAWKNVDFNFPSSRIRNLLIRNGGFIPNNTAVLDVDLYKCQECCEPIIFVTTPRLRPGTPVTLSTVEENGSLSPYPTWSWHYRRDCSGITSVFRIAVVDACGRLWVLDTGSVDQFEEVHRFPCPPKIVIFDLETNKTVGNYTIPKRLVFPNSLYGNIVVEANKKQCGKAFAYLADILGYQLVTFNLEKKTFWAWNNKALRHEPTRTNFTTNGVSFKLDDGIMGLSYYPRKKRLYFNSFASVSEFYVSSRFLHVGQSLLKKENLYYKRIPGRRASQSSVSAITNDGILFFNPVSDNSIRCWNVETSHRNENHIVVAQDNVTLQFVTGIKVRLNRLWVVTARLHNFMFRRVNPNEDNYRILTRSVKQLTRGTKCDRSCD